MSEEDSMSLSEEVGEDTPEEGESRPSAVELVVLLVARGDDGACGMSGFVGMPSAFLICSILELVRPGYSRPT